ncbi:MAG: hypothetical protein KGH86_07860 [Thaumarchaeota archaeon]|nr:hypothetical protein [Nitrososphaerota archaeon]MDE1876722.1 hypothetical protein [Nitrososphaerota archaeon]
MENNPAKIFNEKLQTYRVSQSSVRVKTCEISSPTTLNLKMKALNQLNNYTTARFKSLDSH